MTPTSSTTSTRRPSAARPTRLGDKRVAGFNSLFATASIDAAKRYYAEFRQAAGRARGRRPGIPAAEGRADLQLRRERGRSRTGSSARRSSRPATSTPARATSSKRAIADYNATFGTSFDTSADRFQNYYKDLSQRLKNRELDLVIVVNMFLTGFDATTLNTLWVDKNLRAHGLIQAYSRTNRILNSVKTYGNIVCFRDLEEATNDALALFGNKDARGIVLLKPYADYYAEYAEAGRRAARALPARRGHRSARPTRRRSSRSSARSCGCATSSTSFDEFAGNEILSERDFQDYQSASTSTSTPSSARKDDAEKESIIDDVVFEIELIKQVEVNVDYILMLVEKWREAPRRRHRQRDRGAGEDPARHRLQLIPAQQARPDPRVRRLGHRRRRRRARTGAASSSRRKTEELDELIDREGLKPDETRAFVDRRLPRRRDPDDRHGDHQDPAADLALLGRRRPRDQEAEPCSTGSPRSSTGTSG